MQTSEIPSTAPVTPPLATIDEAQVARWFQPASGTLPIPPQHLLLLLESAVRVTSEHGGNRGGEIVLRHLLGVPLTLLQLPADIATHLAISNDPIVDLLAQARTAARNQLAALTMDDPPQHTQELAIVMQKIDAELMPSDENSGGIRFNPVLLVIRKKVLTLLVLLILSGALREANDEAAHWRADHIRSLALAKLMEGGVQTPKAIAACGAELLRCLAHMGIVNNGNCRGNVALESIFPETNPFFTLLARHTPPARKSIATLVGSVVITPSTRILATQAGSATLPGKNRAEQRIENLLPVGAEMTSLDQRTDLMRHLQSRVDQLEQDLEGLTPQDIMRVAQGDISPELLETLFGGEAPPSELAPGSGLSSSPAANQTAKKAALSASEPPAKPVSAPLEPAETSSWEARLEEKLQTYLHISLSAIKNVADAITGGGNLVTQISESTLTTDRELTSFLNSPDGIAGYWHAETKRGTQERVVVIRTRTFLQHHRISY